MDFDDLDEQEERLPDVGVPPREAPGSGQAYEPLGHFPPIKRNFRLPDFDRLPQLIVDSVLRERDLHLKVRPRVSIRAFVFYGAGDRWYEWAELAANAPPFSEIAVHEWPSHGDAASSRGEEGPPESLEALAEDAFRAVRESMEQHAAGGRIAGAPFVLIGHSIGCLLVTALAQLLRHRLALEPAAVAMLDRAAPHLALHSALGQQLCGESPWDFMRDYNRLVYNTAKACMNKDPAKGERMLKMWIDDLQIANDTRPIGFHRFRCDLLVLRATDNFLIEGLREDPDLERRGEHAARERLMGSPPGWAADFSPEQFEEWEAWVEAPGKFVLQDVKTDHLRIKSHPEALRLLWDLLSRKRAADPGQP